MEINHSIENEIYQVNLLGNFTLDEVTLLQEEADIYLEQETLKGMMIGFAEVETIDSSGIGLTVAYHRRLQKQNAKLVLYEMRENVREAYSTTGIDEVVSICDTQEEALEIINNYQ